MTQEKDQQAEYDKAWDEAEVDAEPGKAPETPPESQDEPPAEGETPKETETPEIETPEPAKAPEVAPEPAAEKALRDTKAWATKLAQENAELKRTIEAFQRGDATRKDVKEAEEAAAKARGAIDDATLRAVYDEYPELRGVFDPLVQTVRQLQAETETIRQERESRKVEEENSAKREALTHFETKVKPQVVQKHADFDTIIRNDDYFVWAQNQRPALRVAACESSDPEDIIWALDEYKKHRATPEAAEKRKADEQKRKQTLINAQTLRGGGGPVPVAPGKTDPADYDAGWNDADAILAKQGVK